MNKAPGQLTVMVSESELLPVAEAGSLVAATVAVFGSEKLFDAGSQSAESVTD